MTNQRRHPSAGQHGFPGLWAKWSKREQDVLIYHDKWSPDGHMLHQHLSPLFVELKRRGFDLTTLKFSVRRKEEEK